jgi:hypothetical protein
VTAGVLRRHLTLAEGGVGQLPVTSAVADGIDMRDGRAPMLVGSDSSPPVERDADSLEAECFDKRSPADGDEHEVRLDGFVVAEADRSCRLPMVSFESIVDVPRKQKSEEVSLKTTWRTFG